ncbi:hypothetical protein VNO78_28353 [Psophocarpus tetragonolobus]|uniref:Uncharacterized protein n=1 Tax=Psophocarpus tetragonolobus TaxID=3891 RepID=A0AAN9S2K2_PSOTE
MLRTVSSLMLYPYLFWEFTCFTVLSYLLHPDNENLKLALRSPIERERKGEREGSVKDSSSSPLSYRR